MRSTGRSLLIGLATLLLGAAIFAACGSEIDESTAGTTLPNIEGTTSTTEPSSEGISFASDVQPILEANCVSCHSGTGPGTTHLVMETAGDVASVADFAAHRVETGEMPPWPLSGLEEIAYQFDLSMSDEDRETIIDWSIAGALLDVDATTPLTATNQAYPPIDADLTITADGAYPGSDKLDDYRCRIMDPEFAETSWITSVETQPDETRVLHHSLIFKLPADQRAEAAQLDGADGSPGWTCQTVPILSEGPLQQVGGWAPGTGPVSLPDGAGLRMEAGDALVVQWHYHYDGGPLPDNSGLALELASDEELAAAGGELDPVWFPTVLGPVEIPCASYETGPLCEREAAVARLVEEFGLFSATLPEFINRECGVTPEDFAHFTDGVASSSCDIDVPAGEVVSIWPHMHELGSTYRLTLNPGTPDETILIDIDRWDFNWQLGYYPVETLTFERGDVVRLECGWDRALWPAGVESRYVVWAEGTQDEMCYTGLALR